MVMRRVAVTGIGVVSPLGSFPGPFWERMTAGRSGIARIERFDCEGYGSLISGEVKDFDVDAYIAPKAQRRMDRYSRYAIAAAKMAVGDSGLDFSREDTTRAGVIIGSGVGGLETLSAQHTVLLNRGPSRCSPFMIPEMIANMAGGLVAIEFNLKGLNYCVVSACASGAHSIGVAMHAIRNGQADIMLAGGAEAPVCDLGVAGFVSMKALSRRNDEPERASRPFDRDRDGFVIAEGACVLILEEYERAVRRGAPVVCGAGGVGAPFDALHMTAPADDGEGAARAMRQAMADAGLNAEDVTYVNAHGTSTELNDAIETAAIHKALGERAAQTMVSSTKSMTGHTLGAAGAIEAAVCCLALRHDVVPPTINYENPDPRCDLDYVPNVARETKVGACLDNSLGFGGHNASLAFKKI